MQKVLFARVGNMDYYQGAADERPIGGGKYNEDNIGFEACNFLSVENYIYGYFQPGGYKPGGITYGSINLQRIDPKVGRNDTEVDNVLVIFFTTDPALEVNAMGPVTRSVIVGWYKNATVYREREYISRLGINSGLDGYFLKVKASDAFLLPKKNRAYRLGHSIYGEKKGNPGQSNSFYLYEQDKTLKNFNKDIYKWIPEAIKYVNTYNGPVLQNDADIMMEKENTNNQKIDGLGFEENEKIRKSIENHSTAVTIKYLENEGYEVKEYNENKQKICAYKPYDLLAYKDGKEFYVEVKGTRSLGTQVIFTKNEVELHQKNNNVILSVVHSIQLSGNLTAIKNSGEISVYNPWKIDKDKLTAISYYYKF